jgi:superfamily II DNA/RNA helicase
MAQTFAELGLPANLIKAVTELGFTEATPIQEQTIPLLTSKKTDLVALAQTGTGKPQPLAYHFWRKWIFLNIKHWPLYWHQRGSFVCR